MKIQKKSLDLIDEVDSLVMDTEVNGIIHEYANEASRQFFILGFLKAAELFDLDLNLNPIKQRITSITDYPFINGVLCDVMENKIAKWVKIESAQDAEKTFLDKYKNCSADISDDLNDVATQRLNEGFLNGYIAATKILKGGLM